MHLGAMGDDLQGVTVGACFDERALEAEDAQEIDEVAFDEAQRSQVVEFVLGKR
ncbi:hypothetical protein D3C81_2280830 [compost metagenome]